MNDSIAPFDANDFEIEDMTLEDVRMIAGIARNESAIILCNIANDLADAWKADGHACCAGAIYGLAAEAGQAIIDRDDQWLPKSS